MRSVRSAAIRSRAKDLRSQEVSGVRARAPVATGRALARRAPDEGLEVVACPSCGSHAASLALHARDRLFARPGWYRVVRCDPCRTMYLNPRPTEEALKVHYPPDYLPVRRPESMGPALRALTRWGTSARWAVYTSMVEKVIGRIPADARVADVGCGCNELLSHLGRTRRCRGVGVDFDPGAAEYVRESLRMPIFEGTLQQAGFDEASFDLVTMNQYLEHEPDPAAVLRESRRISRKGAHLVVEVPHASGLPARVFGTCWSQLDVPRHLTFFTPETLSSMLERSGFQVIQVVPFGVPFSIGISVLQSLGFKRLGRLTALDTLLILVTGAVLLPFFRWLPEFMLVVARAE